jgi:hypothetical protein
MQEEIAQEQEQAQETNPLFSIESNSNSNSNSKIKAPFVESSNSNSNSGFHNSNSPITAPSGEIDWGSENSKDTTPAKLGIEFTDLSNQPATLSLPSSS